MIGESPKHADPVEDFAHGQTARRPQCQGGQQRDPHIVQALKGQHVGQLSVTHAYGLEHTELLLAGEKIGNQGISQVNQSEHKDKDQDAVVPDQFSRKPRSSSADRSSRPEIATRWSDTAPNTAHRS